MCIRDSPWIEDAYSYDEIKSFGGGQLGARGLLWNSFHPDRTADVVVLYSPHVLVALEKGTSHGTHHAYDRRIPLYFYGPGVVRGEFDVPAGSHDILPTLFGALDMPIPQGLDGRDLQPSSATR